MEEKNSRKRRQAENADIEECYANALQSNLEKIVDIIDFKDSFLPDVLLRDGHITENELNNIKSLLDRNDQVRALFSIIKGRDKRVLKALYDYIQTNHGDSKFSSDIKKRFEQNKKEKLNSNICVVCRIKKHVNVKYVIDGLFSQFAIEDGIYNDCLLTDKPTGAQDSLWELILDALNNLSQEKSVQGYETLLRILHEKNHYNHLADSLKNCLRECNYHVKLTCRRECLLKGKPSTEPSQTSGTLTSSDSDVDSLQSSSTFNDGEQKCKQEQHNIVIEGQGGIYQNQNKKKDNCDSVGDSRHSRSTESDGKQNMKNEEQAFAKKAFGASPDDRNEKGYVDDSVGNSRHSLFVSLDDKHKNTNERRKKEEQNQGATKKPKDDQDDLVFEIFYHRSGKQFQCIYQSGMRFYLDDWGSKEWKPFPKRWYNEGLLATTEILHESTRAYSEAAGKTSQGQNSTPKGLESSGNGGEGDDREGFITHPSKGRIPTYIFYKKQKVHMYFDKVTGTWVRMPIAWELHHTMVKSLVDQVQAAIPVLRDRHDILSLLRACNYDPDECISIYKHLEGDEWMKASETGI